MWDGGGSRQLVVSFACTKQGKTTVSLSLSSGVCCNSVRDMNKELWLDCKVSGTAALGLLVFPQERSLNFPEAKSGRGSNGMQNAEIQNIHWTAESIISDVYFVIRSYPWPLWHGQYSTHRFFGKWIRLSRKWNVFSPRRGDFRSTIGWPHWWPLRIRFHWRSDLVSGPSGYNLLLCLVDSQVVTCVSCR